MIIIHNKETELVSVVSAVISQLLLKTLQIGLVTPNLYPLYWPRLVSVFVLKGGSMR